MCHGFFAHQFFIHVGLKRELLHIAVFANFDKAFAPLLAAVPKPLHDAQHREHGAVLFHELLACHLQILCIACVQYFFNRVGGQFTAVHRVVNAFA